MTEHSRCQRGIPRSLARLRSLPQRKVAGAVFIIFVNVDAGSVKHSAKVFLGELSVARKLCDAEVIRSVVGTVGDSFLDELGDEIRHLRDVLGSSYQHWLLDANHGGVFEKSFFVFRGVLLNAHSIARRVANDLVVKVRYVHHIAHGVAGLAQESLEHVNRNEGSEVADVPVIVDCRTTGIHMHFMVT
jgi:hypothetical protein